MTFDYEHEVAHWRGEKRPLELSNDSDPRHAVQPLTLQNGSGVNHDSS